MDIKDIQEQAYQRGLEEGRSQGLLEQELKHRMAAFCDVSCIRIISCEDSTVHYLDFPDGLRLISHEGKYVGWYACDGHDAPDFKQREKLVVLIGEIQDEGVDYAECFRDGDRPGYISNYVLADHLIANGVTVQDGKDTGVPTKWIPVTERLPEPKENPVLVVYNGCVWAAWEHDNYWELVPGLNTTCVTHWMPMPEPPKEG